MESRLLGNTKFQQNDYSSALEYYSTAINECDDPVHISICHSNRAACFIKLNLFNEAIEECNRSLESNPSNLKSLYRKAISLKSINQLTEALICYQEILKIDPGHECKSEATNLEKEIKDKNEKEKEEMLSKLKSLGNQFLGKFGMSTDDFKFQKGSDGKYSVSTNKN